MHELVPSQLAVTLPLPGVAASALPRSIDALSSHGITHVSTGEVNHLEGVTPLAYAAGVHPSLELTCAILSVYTRTPPTLALTAATLASLAPGRINFGIGTSSKTIVEDWNGVPFERPFRRVRDVLAFLRDALAGVRDGEAAGRLGLRGFRLAELPEVPPRLWLAALGPRMQHLAAEQADGVLLNFLEPLDMTAIRTWQDEASRQLPAPLHRHVRIFASVHEGDQGLAAAKRHLTGYLTVPVYARFQEWLGRGERLEPMQQAWQRGDRRGALDLVPEDVVRALVSVDGPCAAAEAAASYLEQGADSVSLALIPPAKGDEVTAEESERFVAELMAGFAAICEHTRSRE